MPVGLLPALLGLAIVVTLGSAFYLLFHARAVAAMFRKPGNDLAPGPGRRPPSRGRLLAAIGLFIAGSLVSVLILPVSGADPVENAVEGRSGEVQRP